MSPESGPTKPFVRTIVLDDGNSPSALNAALNAATCSAENLERILGHDVASPPLIDLSDSLPFRGASDIESGRNRGGDDSDSNRLSFNAPNAPKETGPENARIIAPTPMERRGDDAGQERSSQFQNPESESVPWSLRHNSEAANDLANAIWTRLSGRSHEGAGMEGKNFINDDSMGHSPTFQGREDEATEQGGMRHDSVPPDMRKNSEVAAELANRVRDALFAKR